MPEATSGGNGGGCLKTEQVNPDRPVGNDWSVIVDSVRKSAAKQARAHLETQDDPGDGEVEVHIAISAFLRFPHEGTALRDDAGVVRCACTNDGVVCVCIGQCDFDACCDAPDAGHIVAVRQ